MGPVNQPTVETVQRDIERAQQRGRRQGRDSAGRDGVPDNEFARSATQGGLLGETDEDTDSVVTDVTGVSEADLQRWTEEFPTRDLNQWLETDEGGVPDSQEGIPEQFLEGTAQTLVSIGNIPQYGLAAETVLNVTDPGTAEAVISDPAQAAETSAAFAGQTIDSAVEFATKNPGSAAGVGAATLLTAGASAAGRGSAGISSARSLSRGDVVDYAKAEVDPRVNMVGDFRGSASKLLRDDTRGQADLAKFLVPEESDGAATRTTGSDFGGTTDEVELIDETALAEVKDATSQQLDQATLRAERRAAEARWEDDPSETARDPSEYVAPDRGGGYEPPEPDYSTVSGGPDTSRSGPTPEQQSAYSSGQSRVEDPVSLSPRESQLAAGMDTPDADLRDVDSVPTTDLRDAQSPELDPLGRGEDTSLMPGQATSPFGLADVATGSTVAAGALARDQLAQQRLEYDVTGADADAATGEWVDTNPAVDTGVDVTPDTFTDVDVTPDTYQGIDAGIDFGVDQPTRFDTDLRDPTTTTEIGETDYPERTWDPDTPTRIGDPDFPKDPPTREPDRDFDWPDDFDGRLGDDIFGRQFEGVRFQNQIASASDFLF
jgi:hypothetical protein